MIRTIPHWLLVLGASLALSGCGGERTERLIDYVDPEGMVVVTKEEGAEAIKHVRANEYVVLSNGNYLIHKSRMRSLGDYAIISAAAPVTITIDSAMYVVEGAARLLMQPLNRRGGDSTVLSISLPLLLFK